MGDLTRCSDLARLLSVLRKSQYTVVLVVTKLLLAREAAIRNSVWQAHNGEVGKDPRSCYESFVSRYLYKVSAALQAKAQSEIESPEQPFPVPNVSIFDAPTWANGTEYRNLRENDRERRHTLLPHFKYATVQLRKILDAVCIRSHAE